MNYSTNPLEERVLNYRPQIEYTPDVLQTIDNLPTFASDSSLSKSDAAAVTLRFLRLNATTVRDVLAPREQRIETAISTAVSYLSDANYRLVANEQVKSLYGIETLTPEEYMTIGLEERLIHDQWFRAAAGTGGLLNAEILPLLRDMQADLARTRKILNEVILHRSGHVAEDATLEAWLKDRATNYENRIRRMLQAQADGQSFSDLSSQNLLDENTFRLETDLSVICSNSCLLLDQPISKLEEAAEQESSGGILVEAYDYIKYSNLSREELLAPLLYEHKAVSRQAVAQYLSHETQYSQAQKDKNLQDIHRLGRTWRDICLPVLVKTSGLEYNNINDKLISHTIGGIAEINRDFQAALKDHYKMAVGSSQVRTKLAQDLSYKNLARNLYKALK